MMLVLNLTKFLGHTRLHELSHPVFILQYYRTNSCMFVHLDYYRVTFACVLLFHSCHEGLCPPLTSFHISDGPGVKVLTAKPQPEFDLLVSYPES